MTKKLPLFVQEGERILPCNYAHIQRGDFVDVSASIEIVTRPNGGPLSVHFAMTRVVLLKASAVQLKVSLVCLS